MDKVASISPASSGTATGSLAAPKEGQREAYALNAVKEALETIKTETGAILQLGKHSSLCSKATALLKVRRLFRRRGMNEQSRGVMIGERCNRWK